jgi:hypothetical protein
MSLNELLKQIEPLLQSDKFEDLIEAIKTLNAARPQLEAEEQERMDDLILGILEVIYDPTWDEEDDGIPTLDVNTGKWTNADKLEG